VLAALGVVSLTAEAADELADELARKLGLDRDEMRQTVRDVASAWRGEGRKIGARRSEVADRLVARLHLAQRDEVDDLALRVAQLEHRLTLLERDEHQL
jgi:polyhydroxyalkanoate synthesis regulator phasin